jgi:TPR repeat protein
VFFNPLRVTLYASCLAKGKGFDRDLREATRYFKLAADQSLAQAQFAFVRCVAEGQGVLKDIAGAVAYLERAAVAGIRFTQDHVDRCRQLLRDSLAPGCPQD